MSIKAYKDQQGRELYEVYIKRRSQVSSFVAQRRKRGLETLVAAKRIEKELARECERELLEKESAGSTWGASVQVFGDYLGSDLAKKLAETTREDYLATAKIHTEDWWGKSAANISQRDVQELCSSLQAEGYSHGHVSKILAVIKKIFQYGMEKGLILGISKNPAIGIKLKKGAEIEKHTLDINQIRTLLLHAKRLNHPWYYIWVLALYTGMRNGELYALPWDAIDWVNSLITVKQSYNKKLNTYKCPKAGYSRQVPISPHLRKVLIELKTITGTQPEVLPRLVNWTRGEQARELRQFCMGLGLPTIRFHDLRACFATQLIRNNVPAVQIQKICGWKDLKTMQRYIRLAGIEIAGATESLKFLSDMEVMDEVDRLLGPDNQE